LASHLSQVGQPRVLVSEEQSVIDDLELDRRWQQVGGRIVSAVITPWLGPLPEGVFEQAPRVIATLDNGRDVELFSFYAHERSFEPGQFVSLTVDEGRRLKFAPGNRLDMRHRPGLWNT
jgi:hypothetical protein